MRDSGQKGHADQVVGRSISAPTVRDTGLAMAQGLKAAGRDIIVIGARDLAAG
ncbi:MAG: hypothetical protein AAGF79_03895 [Pseudomonadota bacterium]